MKKISKILTSATILIFLLSFAVTSHAATTANGYCSPTAPHSLPNSFAPLIQCGGSGQPCCDFTEAAILVNRIINWFISMSGVIAAITFSIAGANMLMHPDNPEELKKAKSMFTKTVVGIVIILIAWLVVHTLIATLVNPNIHALRFFSS